MISIFYKKRKLNVLYLSYLIPTSHYYLYLQNSNNQSKLLNMVFILKIAWRLTFIKIKIFYYFLQNHSF